MGRTDPGEKILGSLFQAVTPRTAGYNTVDLTQLSGPTRMIITLLMLVGGAPGSTAGGFKVTTLAVFLLAARAVFRRQEDLQSFGRRLPIDTLQNAAAILMAYVGLFLLGAWPSAVWRAWPWTRRCSRRPPPSGPWG